MAPAQGPGRALLGALLSCTSAPRAALGPFGGCRDSGLRVYLRYKLQGLGHLGYLLALGLHMHAVVSGVVPNTP